MVLGLELSHGGTSFVQSLCYGRLMNTDLKWGKWGLRCFRCCSGFFRDLLNESLVLSWNNKSLLWQFNTAPCFSTSFGFHCGLLEGQRHVIWQLLVKSFIDYTGLASTSWMCTVKQNSPFLNMWLLTGFLWSTKGAIIFSYKVRFLTLYIL